jgi:hypothetical protein
MCMSIGCIVFMWTWADHWVYSLTGGPLAGLVFMGLAAGPGMKTAFVLGLCSLAYCISLPNEMRRHDLCWSMLNEGSRWIP